MKKLILIISVIMVVMVSCKKEETMKPTNLNNYPQGGGEGYTAYRHLVSWQGGLFCEGHGTDCIKANPCNGGIGLRNAMVNAAIALDNAISNNTVADFFTNGNLNTLFPNLSDEHLSLLKNNKVTLVKHDNGVDASPRYIYLAFDNVGEFVFAMEITNL